MKCKISVLALGLWGVSTLTLLGFSLDGSSLRRTCDKAAALTNSTILISVRFTNASPDALRGFFYAEQLPSGLVVTPVAVRINGFAITNAVVETGWEGEVYPSCVPWEWRVETPTNFPEAHPLTTQATVEIDYRLSSTNPGLYTMGNFEWAAYVQASTNAVFGYGETADQLVLSFAATTNRPSVSANYSGSGSTVWLQGEPGVSYVLEGSPNLVSWLPLVTNTCCFSFQDTNSIPQAMRLYRGRVYLPSRP